MKTQIEMTYEQLQDLRDSGNARILQTALEGTTELWRDLTDLSEYVVLADNSVITREEDLDSAEPIFPL